MKKWILLLCLLCPVPAVAANHPSGCTGKACRVATRERTRTVQVVRTRAVRNCRAVGGCR
jgi:hypothetical protein